MTEAAHHYLFALMDGGGTVPPELGVVTRMVHRGHRITVLAEETMRDAVINTGAEYRAWAPLPAAADSEPAHLAYRDWETNNPLLLAKGMADHLLVGPAAAQARDLVEEITSERPARVVTSFTAFGAMAAAESEDVPFDVLIPNIYPVPVPDRPPMGTGLKPARTGVGRLRDRVVGAISTRVMGHFVLPRLNAVRADLGLPVVRTPWDQLHAARRQLILSSRSFDLPGRFPEVVRHVGPILDDPVWTGAGGWTAPSGDEPLVLVALSSTFQGQTACVQNVVDALGDLPVRGLVTTGLGLDPAEVRSSQHVKVVRAAPHQAVLPEAALVITHGGHGTVMKALVRGVPLVIMPHGRDQPDNAVRVATRGAGLTVPRTASAARIGAAVREILGSPSYAQAAGRLGASIRDGVGDSDVVTELESV